MENQILAQLPSAQLERLLSQCESKRLRVGDVLSAVGVKHVYFPTEGLLSITLPVDGREGLEVALIGDEGMLGDSCGFDPQTQTMKAVVLSGGWAWRLGRASFSAELQSNAAFRASVELHTCAITGQLARGAGCARFHVIEARLARWLLMAADRLHSEEVDVTHASIAAILGVRRVGITHAAGSLRARQLIRYQRGHIAILDRVGLQSAACTCYTSISQPAVALCALPYAP